MENSKFKQLIINFNIYMCTIHAKELTYNFLDRKKTKSCRSNKSL